MKTLQKICKFCKKLYKPIMKKGIYKRQLFCSLKCASKNWIENHPKRYHDLQRKSILKFRILRPLLCKYCQKPINLIERASGRTLHKKCVIFQRRINDKKHNLKIRNKFFAIKIKIGCVLCGYKKYGGSLDFHHLNPQVRERRIERKHYFSNSKLIKKELKKCILVCKNCHYELHDLMRTNIEKYYKITKEL